VSLGHYIDILSKIGVTFAAAFGVHSYYNGLTTAEERASRDASLAYIARYNSDRPAIARDAILAFWRDERNSVMAAYIAEGALGLDSVDYRRFARASLLGATHGNNLTSALLVTADLFDEVWSCRVSGQCDAQLLDSFYCERIPSFARLYQPFFGIVRERHRSDVIAQGHESYAAACANTASASLHNRRRGGRR
jgi:hypothetical protein